VPQKPPHLANLKLFFKHLNSQNSADFQLSQANSHSIFLLHFLDFEQLARTTQPNSDVLVPYVVLFQRKSPWLYLNNRHLKADHLNSQISQTILVI